jgi:hypothetical protein
MNYSVCLESLSPPLAYDTPERSELYIPSSCGVSGLSVGYDYPAYRGDQDKNHCSESEHPIHLTKSKLSSSVVELISVPLGYLLLVEPCITLWLRHTRTGVDERNHLRRLTIVS